MTASVPLQRHLALGLQVRYGQTGDGADLASAIGAYRQGCRLAQRASTEVRLAAGRAWGMRAIGRLSYREAAEALGHAADAAGALARRQLSRQTAQTWLAAADDVSQAAALAKAAIGGR